MEALADAAHQLAYIALVDAAIAPVDPKHIDHDWDQIGKGDIYYDDARFDKAIDEYKKAWEEAGWAMKVKPWPRPH